MKITRSYKLRIYPNRDKADTVRYCQSRYGEYVNLWLGRLFFNGNRSLSTAGLGQLANQAQHRARAIIKAQTQAVRATGEKTNVPEFTKECCPGKIRHPRQAQGFDYWVSVSNQWRGKPVAIPCLSHRRLNQKLRQGWELSDACEVFRDREGRYFALVFVSRDVQKAEPGVDTLGCDVGAKCVVAMVTLGGGLIE